MTPESLEGIKEFLKEKSSRINQKLVLYGDIEEIVSEKTLGTVSLILHAALERKYNMATGNRISTTKKIYHLFKSVIDSNIFPELSGMFIDFLDTDDSPEKTIRKLKEFQGSPNGGVIFQ